MSRVADARRASQPTAYDGVRFGLGLLLLVAAGLKGHQLATGPVLGAGLLHSRELLIGVVEFELLFGLWLLAGFYARWTWTAALACFVLLAGVSFCKALSGQASCGCFGKVSVNPWYTFGLDCAVVTALVRWRPARKDSPGTRRCVQRPPWQFACFALGILAVGVLTGLGIGTYQPAGISQSGEISGEGEFVVLEPEMWVGKRLPLLGYIDIGETLVEGPWTLLLYHHDCPECQKVLAEPDIWAGKHAQDGVTPRVALVEIPPYEACEQHAASATAFPVHGRLANVKTWFVETPLVLSLDEGHVTRVSIGGSPNAHRLSGRDRAR